MKNSYVLQGTIEGQGIGLGTKINLQEQRKGGWHFPEKLTCLTHVPGQIYLLATTQQFLWHLKHLVQSSLFTRWLRGSFLDACLICSTSSSSASESILPSHSPPLTHALPLLCLVHRRQHVLAEIGDPSILSEKAGAKWSASGPQILVYLDFWVC